MNLIANGRRCKGCVPATIPLLAATTQAVKAVDPGIIIISGALSPRVWMTILDLG